MKEKGLALLGQYFNNGRHRSSLLLRQRASFHSKSFFVVQLSMPAMCCVVVVLLLVIIIIIVEYGANRNAKRDLISEKLRTNKCTYWGRRLPSCTRQKRYFSMLQTVYTLHAPRVSEYGNVYIMINAFVGLHQNSIKVDWMCICVAYT